MKYCSDTWPPQGVPSFAARYIYHLSLYSIQRCKKADLVISELANEDRLTYNIVFNELTCIQSKITLLSQQLNVLSKAMNGHFCAKFQNFSVRMTLQTVTNTFTFAPIFQTSFQSCFVLKMLIGAFQPTNQKCLSAQKFRFPRQLSCIEVL